MISFDEIGDNLLLTDGNVNPNCVRLLKEGLVCRIPDKVTNAVEHVTAIIEKEEMLDPLMRTDIPVLLSEAIISGQSYCNMLIYQCLRRMSRHVRFYRDGYADLVTQSAYRSACFLAKDETESTELQETLELMSHILEGYSIYKFSPDKRFLEQVNDLVKMFINDAVTLNHPRTLFCTAQLLKAFMDAKALRLKQSAVNTLMENTYHCFTALVSLDVLDEATSEVRILSCSLAAHLCRLIAKKMSDDLQSPPEGNTECLGTICDYVTCVLPHFMTLSVNDIAVAGALITSVLNCLAILLETLPSVMQLGHILCSKGVLLIVPQLFWVSIEENIQDLRAASVHFLSSLLIWLSREVFTFPMMWREGWNHFELEIKSGTQMLPSNFLAVLRDPVCHYSVKVVVLLYLFFARLIEDRCRDPSTFEAVSVFLKQSAQAGSSPLLVKILWFVLALSHLDLISEEPLTNNVSESISMLIVLLRQQDDLDLTYTHHPSLVYHAFQCGVFPPSLQLQVVRLWLSHQDGHGDDLVALLSTCEDARFTMLDLIQTGDELVLNSAFEAFKSLLLQDNGDSQAITVWHVLPNCLAKLSGSTINVENVDRIAQLANLRVPETRDIMELTRTVNLVPSAIAESHIVPLSLWHLAHRLLTLHIADADFRVVTIYMRSEGLVKKVFGNFKSPSPEELQVSLKIAALLCTVHRRENLPPVQFKVNFDVEHFLTILKTGEHLSKKTALLFLQELFDSHWCLPLVALNPSPTREWVTLACFRLQDICIQDGCSEAWECLSGLLLLNSKDDVLTKHLVNNPSFVHLFKAVTTSVSQQRYIADFAVTWLSLLSPCTISSRSLARPMCHNVILGLAVEAVRSFHSGLIPLLSKITECGIDLPLETKTSIIKLLQSESAYTQLHEVNSQCLPVRPTSPEPEAYSPVEMQRNSNEIETMSCEEEDINDKQTMGSSSIYQFVTQHFSQI